MDEVQNTIKTAVESAIQRVELRFNSHSHIFLTEDDLRCNLFSELLKEEVLSSVQMTKDQSYSIPIHSEVRWYGENGRLKIRSDLVILDVANLITSNIDFFRIHSKGYAFRGFVVVIELKLRRPNGPSDNAFKNAIMKDIRKMNELKRSISGQALFHLIIFDKKNIIDITNLREPDIKIHYNAMTMNNQIIENNSQTLQRHTQSQQSFGV